MRRARKDSSPPVTCRPSSRVKRYSASSSQYQSEDSAVRLRKRASLSRTACSAAVRSRYWPIIAAMTCSAWCSRLCGARMRRLVTSSTALTRRAVQIGNSTAA